MNGITATEGAGEMLTVSTLRLLQHHQVRIVATATRLGENESTIMGSAVCVSLSEATVWHDALLHAWNEYGLLGVQGHFMQFPLMWTQEEEPERPV